MPITLSAARSNPSSAHVFDHLFSTDIPHAEKSAPVTLTDYLQKISNFGARQQFERNETIFNQDDTAENVYRILSGTVRLCRYMPDGRRYIVDFLMPGDLMGFVESPDQPVSAEAVTEVTLIAYPRVCFDRMAQESAAVRSQLLCHISSNLLPAHQHLFVLGCQKAKERVASFLLRLADRMDVIESERLDISMSRQDIADHLGLTIETISRMLASLRSDGSILVPNAHQIILRDVHALRALAAEG